MKRFHSFRQQLPFVIIILVSLSVWVFNQGYFFYSRLDLTRQAEQKRRRAEFDRIYGGSDVRIQQFYSAAGSLMEGEHATLCYGVLNAKAVRMDPHVDGVSPSLNRCVEVSPEVNTRYTLIAEGIDGREVRESFTVQVRPDPWTLPKISSFRVARVQMENGRPVYSVAWEAQNGAEISIEPRAFPILHGAPYGRFYVIPEKTTTYTLTVADRKGRTARRQLVLNGPGR